MGNYEDIINLPHHVSNKHPQMSMRDRAAQFSPFAALSGHREAIAETARLTGRKMELDEYEKRKLDEKLIVLQDHISETPEISVTYFCPDENKDGGRYETVRKTLKRIDGTEHVLHMEDGMVIRMDDIFDITCDRLLGT